METWNSILLAITGNAVVLAVLGYLAKSIIEKVIARDSTTFQNDLKAKADSTIEQLKSELQRQTIEHQVRFSKLHEKRGEVIAELYKKLVTANWDAEDFLSPMQWAGDPEPMEKLVKARNSIADAYRYFGLHRIYFPEPLCILLEKIIGDIRSEVIKLGVWIGQEEAGMPDHAQRRKHEIWVKAWEAVRNEIPVATRSLEDEFRFLLSGEKQVRNVVLPTSHEQVPG